MVKLAMVGTGGYAKVHLKALLALQRAGKMEVVALADTHADALAEASRLYPQAAVYADYRVMFAQESIDAVIIATPIPCHETMVLAALEHGFHILLEKPPVPLFSQLQRLVNADPEQRVMVGFQHIYSEAVQAVRRSLLNREYGPLRRITSTGLWPRPRSYYERAAWAGKIMHHGQSVLDGPFTNAFAHFVQNMLYLVCEDQTRFSPGDDIEAELFRARPIESYDTGCISGVSGNGVEFWFAFTHASEEHVSVTTVIECEAGCFTISADGRELTRPDGSTTASNNGHAAMLRAFLAFCTGDNQRNLTPLAAAQGFTSLTNSVFVSSQDIQTLPNSQFDILHADTDQEQYAIRNIRSIIAEALARKTLLSATGLSDNNRRLQSTLPIASPKGINFHAPTKWQ